MILLAAIQLQLFLYQIMDLGFYFRQLFFPQLYQDNTHHLTFLKIFKVPFDMRVVFFRLNLFFVHFSSKS